MADHVIPRGVARAIRFMQHNLAAPVSGREIAAAVGMSERTLRRQFRRFIGQSPIAFHRQLRLNAARQALNDETDVTTAAAAFGFSHFGHFTAQYRRHFDELPSQTLRSLRTTMVELPPPRVRGSVTICVLPFIAGDGPQSGLAAAVAERLTSALARARWLNVVGPKRDAPAEYVVRGRVQNLGARVQVSVRLCHAGTGRHIWGDAFDAAPESAGELQERVTQGAINRILPHLREAASTRPEGWIAPHPTAVACVRQALRAVFEITRSASEHALEKLDRAQSLSPEFPLARAVAAWCHALRAGCFFADNVGAERERARHLTALTLSTDNSDPLVLAVLGNAATVFGDLALGEALIGKCLAIDPDSMTAWQRRGWIASYRGRDTALADFRRALALDTGGFERFNTLLGMSWAHMLAGNYAEGAACAAQALRERPSEAWPYRIAAVAQVLSGQMDEARNSVSRLLRQYPDMTAGKIVDALPDQPANGALMAEALASAGLPV